MKFFVSCHLLLILCLPVRAQQPKDSIFLMTGRILVAPVLDSSLGALTIKDPEDSTKRAHIENEVIFAIKYHTGDIFYYYKEDTVKNFFTRDEMWFYTQGERDAAKGFHANGAFIGSASCGLVGGLSGTFFGPVLPLVYFLCVDIPKVRIKHATVSSPNYLDSDAYILGYEREARRKRRKSALIGGAIGLATGYLSYLAFHNYYPADLR